MIILLMTSLISFDNISFNICVFISWSKINEQFPFLLYLYVVLESDFFLAF